jgi:hypothetical protein
VLENFHLSTTFQLLQDEGTNIFGALSVDSWRQARKIIISCVMETDLSKHFDTLGLFRTRVAAGELKTSSADDRLLLLRMMLKCADIGHSAKPLAQHVEWSDRVAQEFYSQVRVGWGREGRVVPVLGGCAHLLLSSVAGWRVLTAAA